ncbi:MAG: hypothetical protein Q9201_003901 [Fulgogasparrea decipioides]
MAENIKQGIKREFDVMAAETQHSANTKNKDDHSGHHRYGKRLKSVQFTIFVGPSKESFSVHESVLSTSPVLARMCSDSLKNGGNPELNLPDDNPDEIGLLLEFLYGHENESLSDDADFVRASVENRNKASDELCRIHLVGEKYELVELKECVAEKFKNVTDLVKHPLQFLDVAKRMYSQIADSDTTYPEFFIKTAQDIVAKPTLGTEIKDWINREAVQDGRLATDIFHAQREAFITQKQQLEREIRDWRFKWESSNNKVDRVLGHHDRYHDDDDCGGAEYQY